MRRSLVAGNWKMHGRFTTAGELLGQLMAWTVSDTVELAVFPPFVYLPLALDKLANSGIAIGAQTCSTFKQGAYTGEIAADMLTDLGCRYVLVGHSERRQYFGETDEVVAQKFSKAQQAGLHTVLCVGETLQQRDAGQTEDAIARQLQAIFELPNATALLSNSVIAYEPVWAIGTGQSASPEQAQEVHAFMRGVLANVDPRLADDTRLLYGGSVKADNAENLFAKPDIDGVLVGGASLDADQFLQIAKLAG